MPAFLRTDESYRREIAYLIDQWTASRAMTLQTNEASARAEIIRQIAPPSSIPDTLRTTLTEWATRRIPIQPWEIARLLKTLEG